MVLTWIGFVIDKMDVFVGMARPNYWPWAPMSVPCTLSLFDVCNCLDVCTERMTKYQKVRLV
jgi:hypothetical protein